MSNFSEYAPNEMRGELEASSPEDNSGKLSGQVIDEAREIAEIFAEGNIQVACENWQAVALSLHDSNERNALRDAIRARFEELGGNFDHIAYGVKSC